MEFGIFGENGTRDMPVPGDKRHSLRVVAVQRFSENDFPVVVYDGAVHADIAVKREIPEIVYTQKMPAGSNVKPDTEPAQFRQCPYRFRRDFMGLETRERTVYIEKYRLYHYPTSVRRITAGHLPRPLA